MPKRLVITFLQVFFHRSAHRVPHRSLPTDVKHRQWAAHSYAIALVFIAGRFVLGVMGWEALGVEIAQAIIWACLALSVVLADVAIHWIEIRSALTVPVRSGLSRKESLPKNAVGAT